jgi:hypothetical protein
MAPVLIRATTPTANASFFICFLLVLERQPPPDNGVPNLSWPSTRAICFRGSRIGEMSVVCCVHLCADQALLNSLHSYVAGPRRRKHRAFRSLSRRANEGPRTNSGTPAIARSRSDRCDFAWGRPRRFLGSHGHHSARHPAPRWQPRLCGARKRARRRNRLIFRSVGFARSRKQHRRSGFANRSLP